MAEGTEGSAGLVGKVEAGLEGTMDFSSSASANATGGDIGPIINFTGSGMGLVKLLTLAGVTLLILKILRNK